MKINTPNIHNSIKAAKRKSEKYQASLKVAKKESDKLMSSNN
jgi:hypothetical protein